MTAPELSRRDCAAMVVGGPTTVLDFGGLRIVSDPTFDAPGPHGYLTKTTGPAITVDQIGPVDLVLVSHDNHADNFERSGTSRRPGRRPSPVDQPCR
jgi:L-ascorbate metabolism protein UlaG (beta-lactamase superfamily)